MFVLGNSSFISGLPLKLCIIMDDENAEKLILPSPPKKGDNLITEMDNGPSLFTDLCKILHSETT